MRSTKARSTKRSALVVAVVLGAVLSGGAALASCFEHAVDDLTGGNSQLLLDREPSSVPAIAKPQLPDGTADKPQLPSGVFHPPTIKLNVALRPEPVNFARPQLPPWMAGTLELPFDPSKAMIPTS